MKFIKNIYLFSYKIGLCLFLLTLMLILSITLVSLTQRGVVYYGNRCNASLDSRVISFLKQDEIISYDYDFKCNTLYLDLTLKDSLTKDTAKALLVRISSYYESIDYNVDTQITIKGIDYLILSSLIDKKITMSISSL